MNFKKFIRKIALFPLSILMGIEGGASTAAPTEAGAAPVTATAEAQGSQDAANPDTTGAAPETGTAEGQGGEGSAAPDAGATEGDRAPHQKTFEERVEEVATKKVQELERKLEAKQAGTAAEKPNFEILDFAAINRHLAVTIAREKAIQDEIALDPENVDPALISELYQLQAGRDQLSREVRENEQRKGEWIQKAQAQQQSEQYRAQMQSQIEEAGKLVAQDANIPADVWEKGRDFFKDACAKSPLLQRQFDEKVILHGPVAATIFAKEYVEQHMGKKEQDLINQKEAAKQTLPPGKTATGVVVGNPALDALKAQAQKDPTAENMAAYSRAKREAAAQQQ